MGDNIQKETAKKIKRIRLAQKLTIQQVADRLDVARITYAKQESGKENLSLTTLERIASALGVTVSVIFEDR